MLFVLAQIPVKGLSVTRKEKQKWCQEIPSPKWCKDSRKSPGEAGWVTFFEDKVSLNNSTGFLLHTMRTRKPGTKTGNDTAQGSHSDEPRQPQKSKETTKMFRLRSWPVNSVPQNTGLFQLSLSRVINFSSIENAGLGSEWRKVMDSGYLMTLQALTLAKNTPLKMQDWESWNFNSEGFH